jgi:pimeloyl-ACP methyl ester carboxylesterase
MEDYEYLWLLANGKPQIDMTNPTDAFVGQLVASRTLFSHVPTDLAAARAAMGQALGGPTAAKSVNPGAVAMGGSLAYQLTYTHSGEDATLVVTDTVPASTPVITATGPGVVLVNGQAITWTMPMSAGASITLTIQATAALTPGVVTNTAVFSSTQVLTRQVSVLIYGNRAFLPLVLKGG